MLGPLSNASSATGSASGSGASPFSSISTSTGEQLKPVAWKAMVCLMPSSSSRVFRRRPSSHTGRLARRAGRHRRRGPPVDRRPGRALGPRALRDDAGRGRPRAPARPPPGPAAGVGGALGLGPTPPTRRCARPSPRPSRPTAPARRRVRLTVTPRPTLLVEVDPRGPACRRRARGPSTAVSVAGGVGARQPHRRAQDALLRRLAAAPAPRGGGGADHALLLDRDGRLGEAAVASVFCAVGRRDRHRPRPTACCPASRGRSACRRSAPRERAAEEREWRAAREIVAVNAVRGATAITAVDGSRWATGRPARSRTRWPRRSRRRRPRRPRTRSRRGPRACRGGGASWTPSWSPGRARARTRGRRRASRGGPPSPRRSPRRRRAPPRPRGARGRGSGRARRGRARRPRHSGHASISTSLRSSSTRRVPQLGQRRGSPRAGRMGPSGIADQASGAE